MKKFEYSSMKDKFFSMTGNLYNSVGGFDKARINPVECRTGDPKEIRNWCEEQFGNNWIYEWDTYYFKYEADALLFALRWL
jgi:hypothetical protein